MINHIENGGENKIKKILFLGRLAPITDIETLIKAFNIVKRHYNKVELDLVGPVEKEYEPIISKLISEIGLGVNLPGPVYDLKEKIGLLDSADVFVLPSKREAMPQALIEAMSRGKLVISSKTEGGKEIVQDNKTGLLFEIGDYHELAQKILFSLDKSNSKLIKRIEKQALESARQFSWKRLIKKIKELICEVTKE